MVFNTLHVEHCLAENATREAFHEGNFAEEGYHCFTFFLMSPVKHISVVKFSHHGKFAVLGASDSGSTSVRFCWVVLFKCQCEFPETTPITTTTHTNHEFTR